MTKTLYLGLNPPAPRWGEEIVHYPVIQIHPLPIPCCDSFEKSVQKASHFLFTSQTAVQIFMEQIKNPRDTLHGKECLAIGSKTLQIWLSWGNKRGMVARQSTQEGMIALLEEQREKIKFLFYPHSARARPLLREYLQSHAWAHETLTLYDTKSHVPGEKPLLEQFSKIVFTSPSTVDGFFALYSALPAHLQMETIGPITRNYLFSLLDCLY